MYQTVVNIYIQTLVNKIKLTIKNYTTMEEKIAK